jgi:hypothetical protein
MRVGELAVEVEDERWYPLARQRGQYAQDRPRFPLTGDTGDEQMRAAPDARFPRDRSACPISQRHDDIAVNYRSARCFSCVLNGQANIPIWPRIHSWPENGGADDILAPGDWGGYVRLRRRIATVAALLTLNRPGRRLGRCPSRVSVLRNHRFIVNTAIMRIPANRPILHRRRRRARRHRDVKHRRKILRCQDRYAGVPSINGFRGG